MLDRFLSAVEKGGNALPHPAMLFLIFALAIVVCSAIATAMGMSDLHPKTGEPLLVRSLLTREGLTFMLNHMVTNFTGFAPLGTVMVALLGIGLAEASGLIGAIMRLIVLSSPRWALTFVVVFAGILSNVGSEIGYVLLVPLSASIFQAVGRHPIAGLAAGFAGVSGGYSANLLLGTIDPLLSGITQESARLVDASITISPVCNYYFMAASTFFIAMIGTLITDWIVVPRLGPYVPPAGSAQEAIVPLSRAEKRGLFAAVLVVLVFAVIILAGTIPEDGLLRDEKGDLFKGPFFKGIVAFIFMIGAFTGIAYGRVAGTMRGTEAAIAGMSKSMATLGGYMVLVFFAAQFVKYFEWTEMGFILAVKGAAFIKTSGLSGIPLIMSFVLLTALINLFMGSASAKWTLMAPVFVPMLLLAGYDPALTQVAYRIGDSTTNIISPMMSYFALIIVFFQRFDPKAGIGTLVSTMLPYSIGFLICWSIMLAIWMSTGLAYGPG